MSADIAFAVDQQFVKESEGLHLLPRGEVGAVFLEDVEVDTQLFPIAGGVGGFDDVAEFLLAGKLVHQAQMMLH